MLVYHTVIVFWKNLILAARFFRCWFFKATFSDGEFVFNMNAIPRTLSLFQMGLWGNFFQICDWYFSVQISTRYACQAPKYNLRPKYSKISFLFGCEKKTYLKWRYYNFVNNNSLEWFIFLHKVDPYDTKFSNTDKLYNSPKKISF